MSNRQSLILLSGGLDSAANLALACEGYGSARPPALALTLDYGQKAARAEKAAARALSEFYDIRHLILDVSWLGKWSGSALNVASQAIPDLASHLLDDISSAQATAHAVWVPNRNGLFINIAASLGESLGIKDILVGFNREEAATFPDNSPEFLKRASDALQYSTANQMEVKCFTLNWTKTEIVEKLCTLSRPFPFDRVWACYQSGPKPCQQCESCRRFARALRPHQHLSNEVG